MLLITEMSNWHLVIDNFTYDASQNSFVTELDISAALLIHLRFMFISLFVTLYRMNFITAFNSVHLFSICYWMEMQLRRTNNRIDVLFYGFLYDLFISTGWL